MIVLFVLILAVVCWLVFRQSVLPNIYEFWDRYTFAQTLPGPGFFSIFENISVESKFEVIYYVLLFFVTLHTFFISGSLSWVTELSNTYGSVYRVWFGLNVTIFVSDAEYLRVRNNN